MSWNPLFAHFLLGQLYHILALEQYLAGGGLEKTQDCAPRRGFSAAGLADDAERFTLFDCEGDIIDVKQRLCTHRLFTLPSWILSLLYR